MKLIFFISIFLLLTFGCRKNQPKIGSTQNACDCLSEVNADFLMDEMTSGNDNFAKYTSTDSIFKGKNVRFTAITDNAEYKWHIGSEILETKTFKRYFDVNLAGNNIPITLVVRKQPNKICFPNDDGYDSITRILSVTNFPIYDNPNNQVYQGITEGTFKVKSDHLPDSFNIIVDQVIHPTLGNIYTNIFNYDGLGSDCTLKIFSNGDNYRQLFFESGTAVLNCDYLQGSLTCKSSLNVVFNLTLSVSGNSFTERKYFGRKL
jgi:hypothetical protein